jgi:hypothetical protein
MTAKSWIRNLFARPVTRTIRKAPHRVRPALEVLEDRTVPSRLIGTGLLDAGGGGTPSTMHAFFTPPSDEDTLQPVGSDAAFAGVFSSAPGESSGPAPTGPPSYSTLANGMPILNSHPGSPVAIFLDFNSNAFNGYT